MDEQTKRRTDKLSDIVTSLAAHRSLNKMKKVDIHFFNPGQLGQCPNFDRIWGLNLVIGFLEAISLEDPSK